MASHANGVLETSRMFRPGNCPSWARPGLGGRGRTSYPKPLSRDKLKPIADRPELELSKGRSVLDIARRKSAQHEKDIAFLKTQHRDVLRGLHDEIERLKAENKELHFRLVMHLNRGKRENGQLGEKSVIDESLSQEFDKDDGRTVGHGQDDKAQDMQTMFFEEELSDLRICLQEQLEKNGELMQQIELLREQHQKLVNQSISGLPSSTGLPRQHSMPMASTAAPGVSVFSPPIQQAMPMFPPVAGKGPVQLITQPNGMSSLSRQPQPHIQRSFPVYGLPGIAAGLCDGQRLLIVTSEQLLRAPTLFECEAIIKHLQQVNDKLQHELISVRTDLRDVLYSSKWTPDAFLLAKKYVKDDSVINHTQAGCDHYAIDYSLPRPHNVTDGVSLPSLKPNLDNRVAERHRRQQAAQKAIFRREVLH